MKIIKRNGSEVAFDITKIIVAITKANDSVEEVDRMTPVQIQPHRRVRGAPVPEDEPRPHCGGDPGHGGAPHHGPRGL